jgi:3'(2'), 5'-bisphosphate nucleotidase
MIEVSVNALPSAGTLLDELTTIVSQAAAAALAARAKGLDARAKADLSPVTAADEASEAVILAGVGRLLPGVPIVSEEAHGRAPAGPVGDTFVLVDPLDGTRELVAGRDEFTINLALVQGGVPRLGIVGAPAWGLIWRTAGPGSAERLRIDPGAPASAVQERTAIRPRPLPRDDIVAVVSRSHLDPQTEAFLKRIPGVRWLRSGSSVKLCQVAEGTADLYPRLGPVHEWDLAAGHAVLAAAGGIVVAADGAALSYGRDKQGFRVPGFIAWGDPSAPAKLGLPALPSGTSGR